MSDYSPAFEGLAEIIVLFLVFCCVCFFYGVVSAIIDIWDWHEKRVRK
jgi:hypothetical protein